MDKIGILPELLYFSSADFTESPIHSHDYMQLEFCISGEINVLGREQGCVLRAGEFWLIPPGVLHGFARNARPLLFLSIKFHTRSTVERFGTGDKLTTYFLREMQRIICEETEITANSPEGRTVLENTLNGFLHHLSEQEEEVSPFEKSLQTEILRMGAKADIESLAEYFHLTRSQFKYKFHKNCGGSVKKFIDRLLIEQAEMHIRYSDQSLSRIAEEMHFSSIYAFSRYFKHNCGESPSAFRTMQNPD